MGSVESKAEESGLDSVIFPGGTARLARHPWASLPSWPMQPRGLAESRHSPAGSLLGR